MTTQSVCPRQAATAVPQGFWRKLWRENPRNPEILRRPRFWPASDRPLAAQYKGYTSYQTVTSLCFRCDRCTRFESQLQSRCLSSAAPRPSRPRMSPPPAWCAPLLLLCSFEQQVAQLARWRGRSCRPGTGGTPAASWQDFGAGADAAVVGADEHCRLCQQALV